MIEHIQVLRRSSPLARDSEPTVRRWAMLAATRHFRRSWPFNRSTVIVDVSGPRAAAAGHDVLVLGDLAIDH